MISPGALEEGVLCLLVFSPEHAPTIAMRVAKHPWTNQPNKRIAEAALEHLTKYNVPPGQHIEALLEPWITRGEEGKLLGQTIRILGEQIEVIQPQFIIDELETFISSQRLRDGLERALESLHRGELDTARKEVANAQIVESHAEGELWLKDPKQAFSFIEDADENFFSSGVDAIDVVGATPDRGTLSLMIASTGKGKSWWLGECGKRGLMHHHAVLHVTLENSHRIAAMRYLQSLFSVTKREAKTIHTAFFNQNNETQPIDFRDIQRSSVIMERQSIEMKLRAMVSFPRLLIKKHPTGQLTVAQLKLYLDHIKIHHNFIPDAILIDYADLMFIDPAQLRIDTGRLYKELRGLADEYNAAVYTASQGNKESDTAKTVDRRHVAEDWSKVGTADNVYTYSQTDDEKKMGLARILVAKCRNERDRFMVLVSQAYAIGQFCLDSVYMDVDVSAEVDRLTGND